MQRLGAVQLGVTPGSKFKRKDLEDDPTNDGGAQQEALWRLSAEEAQDDGVVDSDAEEEEEIDLGLQLEWTTTNWSADEVESGCDSLINACRRTADPTKRRVALRMLLTLMDRHRAAMTYMEQNVETLANRALPHSLKHTRGKDMRLAYVFAVAAPRLTRQLSMLNIMQRALGLTLKEMDLAALVIQNRFRAMIQKWQVLPNLPAEDRYRRLRAINFRTNELNFIWRDMHRIAKSPPPVHLDADTVQAYLTTACFLCDPSYEKTFSPSNRADVISSKAPFILTHYLIRDTPHSAVTCKLFRHVCAEPVLFYPLLKMGVVNAFVQYLTRLGEGELQGSSESVEQGMADGLECLRLLSEHAVRIATKTGEFKLLSRTEHYVGRFVSEELPRGAPLPVGNWAPFSNGGGSGARIGEDAYQDVPLTEYDNTVDVTRNLRLPDTGPTETIQSTLGARSVLVKVCALLQQIRIPRLRLLLLRVLHNLSASHCYHAALTEVTNFGARTLAFLVEGLSSEQAHVPQLCLHIILQLCAREDGRAVLRKSIVGLAPLALPLCEMGPGQAGGYNVQQLYAIYSLCATARNTHAAVVPSSRLASELGYEDLRANLDEELLAMLTNANDVLDCVREHLSPDEGFAPRTKHSDVEYSVGVLMTSNVLPYVTHLLCGGAGEEESRAVFDYTPSPRKYMLPIILEAFTTCGDEISSMLYKEEVVFDAVTGANGGRELRSAPVQVMAFSLLGMFANRATPTLRERVLRYLGATKAFTGLTRLAEYEQRLAKARLEDEFRPAPPVRIRPRADRLREEHKLVWEAHTWETLEKYGVFTGGALTYFSHMCARKFDAGSERQLAIDTTVACLRMVCVLCPTPTNSEVATSFYEPLLSEEEEEELMSGQLALMVDCVADSVFKVIKTCTQDADAEDVVLITACDTLTALTQTKPAAETVLHKAVFDMLEKFLPPRRTYKADLDSMPMLSRQQREQIAADEKQLRGIPAAMYKLVANLCRVVKAKQEAFAKGFFRRALERLALITKTPEWSRWLERNQNLHDRRREEEHEDRTVMARSRSMGLRRQSTLSAIHPERLRGDDRPPWELLESLLFLISCVLNVTMAKVGSANDQALDEEFHLLPTLLSIVEFRHAHVPHATRYYACKCLTALASDIARVGPELVKMNAIRRVVDGVLYPEDVEETGIPSRSVRHALLRELLKFIGCFAAVPDASYHPALDEVGEIRHLLQKISVDAELSAYYNYGKQATEGGNGRQPLTRLANDILWMMNSPPPGTATAEARRQKYEATVHAQEQQAGERPGSEAIGAQLPQLLPAVETTEAENGGNAAGGFGSSSALTPSLRQQLDSGDGERKQLPPDTILSGTVQSLASPGFGRSESKAERTGRRSSRKGSLQRRNAGQAMRGLPPPQYPQQDDTFVLRTEDLESPSPIPESKLAGDAESAVSLEAKMLQEAIFVDPVFGTVARPGQGRATMLASLGSPDPPYGTKTSNFSVYSPSRGGESSSSGSFGDFADGRDFDGTASSPPTVAGEHFGAATTATKHGSPSSPVRPRSPVGAHDHPEHHEEFVHEQVVMGHHITIAGLRDPGPMALMQSPMPKTFANVHVSTSARQVARSRRQLKN